MLCKWKCPKYKLTLCKTTCDGRMQGGSERLKRDKSSNKYTKSYLISTWVCPSVFSFCARLRVSVLVFAYVSPHPHLCFLFSAASIRFSPSRFIRFLSFPSFSSKDSSPDTQGLMHSSHAKMHSSAHTLTHGHRQAYIHTENRSS